MKLPWLTLFVGLLIAATVRAVPYSVDDDANDEMDSYSSSETQRRNADAVGLKANGNLEILREKMKKLNEAVAERVGKGASSAARAPIGLHDAPQSSNFDQSRSAFPSVEKINEHIADVLYEGDILLTVKQADDLLKQSDAESDSDEESTSGSRRSRNRRIKRKITSDGEEKWPITKPISYFLSADLTEKKKQVIDAALNFWQSHTCLTFKRVEELADDEDGIRFINDDGCYSNVGRIGGNQDISIADGCEFLGFGVITHEIGHALGFYHEQSRFDRDRFVTLNKRNIDEEDVRNFNQEPEESLNIYGIPYEYGSVMHYGRKYFALNNGVDVLIAKDRSFQQTMGQRTEPSFFDVYLANRHYDCIDKCSAASTDCRNGGYPNPRNCNKCNCPSGFGGDFCTEPQTTEGRNCGQRLTASESWQDLEATVGEHSYYTVATVWKPNICSWHLMAPVGERIEVRITKLKALCRDGCNLNALQIKTSSNFKAIGMRVCCKEDYAYQLYKSESNLLPVIAEAYYRFSFKLQYRLVRSTNTASSGEEEETSAEESYQETECQEAGGFCKDSSECTSGTKDAALCPKQSSNVVCCLPTITTAAPRSGFQQERTCLEAHGVCQSAEDTCSGKSRPLCPSQSGATCCIAVYQERKCKDAGGVCQSLSKSCSGTWRFSMCPTQTGVSCCVPE